MSDGVSARTFKGRLASGKPVYVRRAKRDRSESRIAFAVYAEASPGGRMELVAKFHDRPTRPEWDSRCDGGASHEGPCSWSKAGEAMTPREAAKWSVHWWSRVAGRVAEVVELQPVGSP